MSAVAEGCLRVVGVSEEAIVSAATERPSDDAAFRGASGGA